MTNASIKATFSTHKTNRVVQGIFDHLPVRFACVGDKRVHIETSDGGVHLDLYPVSEFESRLASCLGEMTRGYNW